MARPSPLPGILGLVASTLGLLFAGYSTHDYAQHLDRRLHGTHCSLLPGIEGAAEGANACTAAMYSPFSAILKTRLWGGLPISLLGFGAYVFFFAAALALAIRYRSAPRSIWLAFGLTAITPALVSVAMAGISWHYLGVFCKLCIGMYGASIILALAGALALATRPSPVADVTRDDAAGQARRGAPSLLVIAAAFALLGLSVSVPSAVYAGSLPDYSKYTATCGKLAKKEERAGTLLSLPSRQSLRKLVLFVDPLCPTCRGLHDRLEFDSVLARAEVTLVLFPLDNECNWMLERPLHPGACTLSRAVLCGDKSGRSKEILEWAYRNQTTLLDAGKADKKSVRARVVARFPDVESCLDTKETHKRLEGMLQYAVANQVPVSTPQLYLDDQRICEEDTDLGLSYTLRRMAPELLP